MEVEMERLVKEKEQTDPMEVIPLSAFPLTEVSTMTTSTTTTIELSSTTPLIVLETSETLAKSMEEMTIQGAEIKRLKQEKENLQKLKSSFQAIYNTERDTSEKLKKELQHLQKQTILGKKLAEAKENI
jgi:hypothetical protein